MDALKKIKRLLDIEAGFDIGHKRRKSIDVDFRSLFFMMSLYSTNRSLEKIGAVVNRDHATVTHARTNLFDELMKKERFKRLFKEYKRTKIKENPKNNDIEPIDLLQEKYDDAKQNVKELKKLIEKKALLTPIEIKYRELTPKQQEIYNERADLVLKSFNWKKYNSTFEKVYVGLTPL